MAKKAKKILVIDDEEPLRKMIRDVLDDEGFIVSTAEDGNQGLKNALKNHPDLIILDLLMPGMDGLTMLGQLREDKWGSDAEVIVLSNLDDRKRLAQAMRMGVCDYVVKANWEIYDIVKKVKKKLN